MSPAPYDPAKALSAAKPGATLLDMRGYRCPMPVIRMEAALRRMKSGAQLIVIADDPVAAVDIPHFCEAGGHDTTRLEGDEGCCVFLVTHGEKG